MSLTIASHDALPYIESAPTSTELATISHLIAAELPAAHKTTPHPSLPPAQDARFSPLIQAELDRVARAEPLSGGIDLSRYEPPSPPPGSSSPAEDWVPVLQSAYSSTTHLSTRLTNLSLLSEFGKNAWLVHNAQLEDILKRLEEDLMYAKTERELVNKDRKRMQRDVEADMKRLQGRWKRSVGRVLEVEVATEALRREIVDRQRGS